MVLSTLVMVSMVVVGDTTAKPSMGMVRLVGASMSSLVGNTVSLTTITMVMISLVTTTTVTVGMQVLGPMVAIGNTVASMVVEGTEGGG